MIIRVRAFAGLREALGLAETEVTVPSGASVQDVLAALMTRYPQAGLAARRFGVAINRAYATPTTVLHEGDEVALIPPVSGGAAPQPAGAGSLHPDTPRAVRVGFPRPGTSPAEQPELPDRPTAQLPLYEITDRPLSLDDVLRRVAAPDRGGVTLFAGTVRGITRPRDGSAAEIATDYLEYEAYGEMAAEALARIGAEVQARWPAVSAVSIVHRIGRLEVGDIAVIVAVAAAHRQDTFDACHYAIDRIKQIAPIWKKEVGPDGAVWIEGPDSTVNL